MLFFLFYVVSIVSPDTVTSHQAIRFATHNSPPGFNAGDQQQWQWFRSVWLQFVFYGSAPATTIPTGKCTYPHPNQHQEGVDG